MISAVLLVSFSAYRLRDSMRRSFAAFGFERNAKTLGNDMLEASNYLSDSAKQFAVSLDAHDLAGYCRQLEVKNPRDKAIEPLLLVGGSTAELSLLALAKDRASALSGMEIRSIRLIEAALDVTQESLPRAIADYALTPADAALSPTAQIALSRTLLFGTEYSFAKGAIAAAIGEYRDGVQERAATLAANATMEADRSFAMQIAFLLAVLGIWIAILSAYYAMIVTPLASYRAAIATVDDGLPALKPQGTLELRNLAEAFNAMTADAESMLGALRDSEARLQLHLRLMPLGSVELDSDFRITRWNPAAERIFGWEASEAIGASLVDLIVPERSKTDIVDLLDSLRSGSSIDSNVNYNVRKDGQEILCEWYNTTIYESDGSLFGWASIVKDITDVRREADRMIYLSTHDTLTGIRNRRYAQERLDEECLRSARDGNPYSVAMVDVDQFKRFNDMYGHECGDVVLRGIAEAMIASVRETDSVSRWGGEEFLIILPGTCLQGAVEVAEKIRLKIQETEFEYGGERLHVTVTAGVMSTEGNESSDTCVRLADMALLSGKAKGRNIVVASVPSEDRLDNIVAAAAIASGRSA